MNSIAAGSMILDCNALKRNPRILNGKNKVATSKTARIVNMVVGTRQLRAVA